MIRPLIIGLSVGKKYSHSMVDRGLNFRGLKVLKKKMNKIT